MACEHAEVAAAAGGDVPLVTAPPLHQDSVLLITLDSCRYDSFRGSTTPAMDRVAPLHRAMAPSHFTFGSHSAIFKGFLPSVRAPRPLLNSKLAKLFRLAHAGWPGKEREEFQLKGPSIIEGFRRLGYRTIGSGAVGWFDPATETGRCLTAEFERFYYPGSTWQLPDQLAWIEVQRRELSPDQPLMLFLNVGETHVPYWHSGATWDRDDNPCVPFQSPSRERQRTCRRRQRACLEHVDDLLAPLLEGFRDATTVITADHGDCWGEDGLWEHGISHRCTLEVPLLMRVRGAPLA